MTTAKMISAFERYFTALNNQDQVAYLACFSGDAEVHDPYGGSIFIGEDGLRKWFRGMQHTWTEFHIQPESTYQVADRVAIQWLATATTTTGKRANFSGINIFTIDDRGLILRLEGYWDVSAMMAQIA